VDSAHGNINYFMPHHHDYLHVTTSDNSTNPNTTGSSFIVRTPDGTEYYFGGTTDSLRSTVTAGAKTYYEWDLNKVIRPATTPAGYLQQYTISYWQDTNTNSGITYVRDAAPREIDYNFINGSADARVYFNVHWPHSTTTTGPATATTYGNNYNCASTPLVTTTLRCDDPVTPSLYEAAPLTMSTITLDQVFMQAWSQGAWNTVRRYDLTYAQDTPAYSCTDDVTGGPYACSGEHLLTSVQEIPYQSPYQSTNAMPSRQPIAFTYTSTLLDEYFDLTHNGFDSNPFDSQRRWQYLATFTDQQTGAGASVQWNTAWANTHGVPTTPPNLNDLDPWTCGYAHVTCSNANDRQWMRQTVASITDTGNNLTTNYQYWLNPACGSNCTQDTWIAPNSYNACNGVPQGPSNPMPSCLIQGPYTNYYNEDYTGFLQVQITNPDGSTAYTQYYAGDGWGTNDWQFPNVYHGFAQIEDTYQGAATGTPLEEVDHTYIASNCPTIDTNGDQLIVNGYMLCNSYETQRDTYIGGSSGSSGVPHLTQTWTYSGLTDPTLGMQYHELNANALTSNDALSDSFTNYGTTQPTFTTNYTYVRHDGTLDSPAKPTIYLAGLVAQTTLTDNQGTIWTCSQNQYDDQQTYTTGQDTALVAGLATRSTAWAACSNNTGPVTTSAGYDNYGQPVVSTDADAWGGVSGHTLCLAPSSLYLADNPSGVTTYTSCVSHDSEQQVYPTLTANALNQQTTNTYDVVQAVLLTSKDPNNATTTGAAPVYEYNGSPSLANFQDVYTQTTLPAVAGSPAWTSRTYVYSFCAGATTGGKPCLEVDTVRNYDSSNTDMLVSRTFYDREGRVVEKRLTSAMNGQDSVSVTAYSNTNDTTFTSLACSVPALTTSNGGRVSANDAYYIAPTQTSSGSSAYVDTSVVSGSCAAATLTGTTNYTDALGRSIASDDPIGTGVGTSGTGCLLSGSTYHHTTCATYAPVIASSVSGLPSTDSEPYLQTVTVDANLHQSASYTDAMGRIAYGQTLTGASQTPFGSGIASYGVTRNQYDPLSRLVSVYDPLNHQSTFTYNDLGEETNIADANRGSETYTYDANGNVLTTQDARGSSGTIYAGYDGLNRQVWRNTSNSQTGAYINYTYDSIANGNDGKGRLTSETFANTNVSGSLSGCYAYTYDLRGRVTATTENVGSTNCGIGYSTTTSYNDANQLTSQVYPNGDTLTTSYDSTTGFENELGLTPSGGSQGWLLTSFVYSGQSGAAGLLSSATLGMGSAAVSYSYDGLLRPVDTKYTSGATTLYETQPTYDAVGNVSGETTTLPQGADTQVFCYDEQDRLTWAGSSGTPPCSSSLTPGDTGSLTGSGASYSASYTYDAANRLTSSPLGSYTYGNSSHVDAATSIGGSIWTAGYDAAGNMICRSPSSALTCAGTQNGWTGQLVKVDNEGQLSSWSSFQHKIGTPNTDSFLYDGEGHRIEQVSVVSGTTTTSKYIGSLEEITTTGSTTTTTAYYGGVALSVNGTLSYTLSDGLGSVSAAVSTSGVVTAAQLYGPYGSVRYSNGTMPGTRAYTGQRADAVTGLDYYNARYYDPVAGQFTSADTVLTTKKGAVPTAAQLNRYAYVGGNPETRTDPTGHRYACPDNDCGVPQVEPGDPKYAKTKAVDAPQVGNCLGDSKCVIFIAGVNISLPKAYSNLADDWNQWKRWFNSNSFQGIGVIFLEAKSAIDGAQQIHDYLHQLMSDGYKGTVSLVGHSNGAAALFDYFAELALGRYKGDAPVSRFVAIDAPVATNAMMLAKSAQIPGGIAAAALYQGAVAAWADWPLGLDLVLAAAYISSHDIKGIWAYNANDLASGPEHGPWTLYPVTEGDPWNLQDTHLWLSEYPTPDLVNFASGG
jgi:RHS repeat-associated protein